MMWICSRFPVTFRRCRSPSYSSSSLETGRTPGSKFPGELLHGSLRDCYPSTAGGSSRKRVGLRARILLATQKVAPPGGRGIRPHLRSLTTVTFLVEAGEVRVQTKSFYISLSCYVNKLAQKTVKDKTSVGPSDFRPQAQVVKLA